MTKAQKAEQAEAIAKLREWLKPGDTVYTILDHVSASGMSRAIRVVLLECHDGKPEARHPNWAVGKALDLRHWKRNGREQDALVMGGCGMDMGFALVYNLSSVLYGGRQTQCNCRKPPVIGHGPLGCVVCDETGLVTTGGYACLGKGKCPSNYHNNHHDRVRCEGTMVYNPDGPNTGDRCVHVMGKGYCLSETETLCPTCKGSGYVPNPDGPERFDLVHTDGYALHHRWL